MTIPIDVVVTDATDYSAIVGNDWLAKVKANIDYETSSMLIHWEGKDVEVPIEYSEMPLERRRNCAGVYPKENFILTNEGVYLDESFYQWTYFSRLDEQFRKKPPKRASWVYDWKGPTARCWCGERLYSSSNSCSRCYGEITNFITIRNLPQQIVAEISSGFENQDLNSKNLIWDVMPSEVQLEEAMEVANEHDRQLCFHCGRKSRDEWEQQNEVPLYFGHTELVSSEN
ncbi:hypothetical protein RhiirA5_386023, partial [Rhizophagus irregularis]